jgi:flagellar basal body-associated protein FliL
MKKKSKPIVTIILLVIAIAATISVILIGIKFYSKPHSTSTSLSEKKLPDGTTINTNTETNPSTNQNVSKPETQTANITITQISQNQSQFTIRALVSGITNGKCTLRLTKSNQTITKEANINLGSSYYYCNGYVISKSELTQKGEWELTIYAEGEGKSGAITQKINIE